MKLCPTVQVREPVSHFRFGFIHQYIIVGSKNISKIKRMPTDFCVMALGDRLNEFEGKVGIGAANIPVKVER